MRPTCILAALTLSACGFVAPDTAARLQGFSPLTVDPAGLRAAVRLPEGLSVPPGGATLTFGAERSDTGARALETFALEPRPGAGGLTVFALDPRAAQGYRRLQSTVAAWEETAPEATEGVFALRLSACRVGAGPTEDARVSVYVATEPGAALRPLVVDAPLEGIVALAEGPAAPGCP